jgi:hypothetical protein
MPPFLASQCVIDADKLYSLDIFGYRIVLVSQTTDSKVNLNVM